MIEFLQRVDSFLGLDASGYVILVVLLTFQGFTLKYVLHEMKHGKTKQHTGTGSEHGE